MFRWIAAFVVFVSAIIPAMAQDRSTLPSEPLGGLSSLTIPAPEEPLPEKREAPSAAGGGMQNAFGFGGGMGGMGGPGGGGGGPFSYSATWFPTRNVDSQSTNLGLTRQNLSIGVPVWRDGGDMLLLNSSIRSVLYDSGAIFPTSHRSFPESVYAVNFGTMFLRRFENGWTGGLMLSGGSASDRPFNSFEELNVNVLGFLRVPSGEQNAWLFSLMYSPLGEISFPVPGVSYQWQVDDTFRVNLGVPFSLWWNPVPDVIVDASYMPLTRVHAQTTWKVAGGPVSLFGAFDWNNESYTLASRASNQDRFFAYAQTLTGGLRYQLPKVGILEFTGGYAFDRFFFNGRSYSDRNQDRIDVQPGAFLGLSFRLAF